MVKIAFDIPVISVLYDLNNGIDDSGKAARTFTINYTIRLLIKI